MKSRLTIAITGAVLAHVSAGIAFSVFHWEKQHKSAPPLSETTADRPSEPEFMSMPEKAELLLTPIQPAPTPPLAKADAPITPTAVEPPNPLPPPFAATDAQARQDQARQEAASKEKERLRILRLEAADKALAEARRDVTVPPEARPPVKRSAPPPPRKIPSPIITKANKQNTQPAPRPQGETRGPMTLRQSQPNYPRTLQRQRIGGTVSVLINIDAKGRVTGATVNRSSGHRKLDDAAAAAARRWRFKPALRNGVNTPSKTAVNIVFQPPDR